MYTMNDYIYIYIYIIISLSLISLFLYIWVETRVQRLRDWRHTVGSVIEIVRLKTTYHGPQCTQICVKHRGYGFIKCEISKHTISTVFSQPLRDGVSTVCLPRTVETPNRCAMGVKRSGFLRERNTHKSFTLVARVR